MELKKLQQWLFYLLLFLIPSNLGKHFILPSSYFSGILVDYLIPTIYLTDIIVLILLFSWFLGAKKSNIKNQILKLQIKYQKFKKTWVLFILLYLFLNCLLAANRPAAFYKFFKLLELTGLFFYIKNNINIKKDIKKIGLVLAGSVIFQSVLALAQWTKDGSFFNNYLFFGEQPYSLSTPGIKKISFFGVIKAPPLGTFPHPNVLAGFLVLTFPLILKESLGVLRKTPPRCNGFKKLSLKTFFAFSFSLLAFSLFLTFSLPAWLAFGGMLLIWLYKKGIQSRRLNFLSRCCQSIQHPVLDCAFLLSAVCCLLITTLFFFQQNFFETTSLSRRQTLNQISLKMFFDKPLTGVGLNNFTYVMNDYGEIIGSVRFLQPVHNVYLLILAETGIIGFLIFCYLSFQVLKKILKPFGLAQGGQAQNDKNGPCQTRKITVYCLLFTVYFLLFFDHYLFTTQQGLLLSFLIFSLFTKDSP